MPPETHSASGPTRPMLATLRRFLPYLWPAGAPGLKARIIAALLLVVASKLVQVYGAPFALQGAIDTMAAGSRDALWLVVALVAGYAAARFGGTLFDKRASGLRRQVPVPEQGASTITQSA